MLSSWRDQELLDDRRQFVFFDEDRFGVDPGVEFDLVERLQIRRVGYRDEQAHAAANQRQRVVLADQPLFDEVFGDRIEVERGQIDDRHAEFFGSRCGDRARVGQFVADQIADERKTCLAGVFTGCLRCVRIEDAVLDEASSESRKRYRLRSH